MNDRELLELAAKAADLLGFWVDAGINIGSNEKPIIWNPLTDDGDALRLAVKLRLKVQFFDSSKTAFFGELDVAVGQEETNGDPYTATRRAIVRAAAEIAKMDGEAK